MPRVLGRQPPERLSLPAALAEAVVGHALADRAVEVCGLLGGVGDRARSHYPVANVASSPRDSFLMDPIGQLAAFRAMQARGEALVGIYHSHPAGPPAPSARDLEWAAYPDVAYLIVSLAGEGAPALAGFVFDGQAFRPLRLDREA